MKRLRFSISTLLICVLAVSMYFPIQSLHRQLVVRCLGKDDWIAKLASFKSGDSLQKVSQSLGTLQVVGHDDQDSSVLNFLQIPGYFKDDQVYRYRTKESTRQYLVFRQGKLVWDTQDCVSSSTKLNAAMRELPWPQQALEFGPAPLYCLFLCAFGSGFYIRFKLSI